ncbi:hypothetical protein [Exiguobacterium oxidotolerans]|uniref:hypothetical protein n=1 Tax=Exiguobacterium oxidotolerans TaxID=223958 RepID=UPI000493F74A|nr:hypothetical protein [Exiguobacterium oxidotolerans]
MNLEKVHEQARGDPAAFVKSEAASRLPLSKRTVVEANVVQKPREHCTECCSKTKRTLYGMLFKNQENTVRNVVQKPREHCTECCSKTKRSLYGMLFKNQEITVLNVVKKNALLRDREKDFLKKYQNNG